MMVLNLELSFLMPETSEPSMVTCLMSPFLTESVNWVKVSCAGRSLVLDFTTAQSSRAVATITTQKMMFLTAEFTSDLLPRWAEHQVQSGIPCSSPSRANPPSDNMPTQPSLCLDAPKDLIAQTISVTCGRGTVHPPHTLKGSYRTGSPARHYIPLSEFAPASRRGSSWIIRNLRLEAEATKSAAGGKSRTQTISSPLERTGHSRRCSNGTFSS